MTSPHLHLICPGLFYPGMAQVHEQNLDLELPGLKWLLARARNKQNDATYLEQRVCALFDLPRASVPVAALTYQHDFAQRAPDGILRAEPVFLVPQGDSLVMEPISKETLLPDEVSVLQRDINAFLADQGMQLLVTPAGRWYLDMEQPWRIRTTPFSTALSGEMFACLPQGNDGVHCHQWYTEIQMLLHSHEINLAREARGDKPINGIWLWGEGGLCDPPTVTWHQVYAEDALTVGLAQSASTDTRALPQALADVATAARVLVVLPSLPGDDFISWQARLRMMEQYWFEPIKQALIRGVWHTVTLDPGHKKSYDITRSSRWIFWRRTRPLNDFAT
jgi:hypothetical protein